MIRRSQTAFVVVQWYNDSLHRCIRRCENRCSVKLVVLAWLDKFHDRYEQPAAFPRALLLGISSWFIASWSKNYNRSRRIVQDHLCGCLKVLRPQMLCLFKVKRFLEHEYSSVQRKTLDPEDNSSRCLRESTVNSIAVPLRGRSTSH